MERRRLASSPLPQSTLVSLFRSVCLAVRELHQSSPPLAHRDIKVRGRCGSFSLFMRSHSLFVLLLQPHNVLLDRDLSPVLMDFGSCCPARVSVRSMREAQYLQDTAAERSSMCYRPPELFQVSSSCDIDERTDIWSLGCLLYAMMHYQSPYDAVYERGDSVALAVQAGKLTFQPSDYSAELEQLVTEMTNVDINFRINIDSVIEKVEILSNRNCDAI